MVLVRLFATAVLLDPLKILLTELIVEHQTGDSIRVWTDDELLEYLDLGLDWHDLNIEATGTSPSAVLLAAKNAFTALSFCYNDSRYAELLRDLEGMIDSELPNDLW